MAKITTCNICGEEFDFWDTQEGVQLAHVCGYGSKYDGDSVVIDICCKCFGDLIDSCKVNPRAKRWGDAVRAFGDREDELDGQMQMEL